MKTRKRRRKKERDEVYMIGAQTAVCPRVCLCSPKERTKGRRIAQTPGNAAHQDDSNNKRKKNMTANIPRRLYIATAARSAYITKTFVGGGEA